MKEKREPSKGFGATVSKIIKTVSAGKIKECDSCKKRKELLNKIFPYSKKEKDK